MGKMGGISLSVVSHGHEGLVEELLLSLQKIGRNDLEVLLTQNIQPQQDIDLGAYTFPVKVIVNSSPKGFGENHNAAFEQAEGEYFCVLNPDILFVEDPFDTLCDQLNLIEFGLVAPKIVDSNGLIQDSARDYPTPLRIIKRVLGVKTHQLNAEPDWVAGMFMLFRSEVYSCVGGFDDRYFLYCEDADICFRLKEMNKKIAYMKEVTVVHNAQRSSHKKAKFMFWHLKSLFRFFINHL